MWLTKKHAGSASGGWVWEKAGDRIEVPDSVGAELIALDPREFSEDTSDSPADVAKAERGKREVTEAPEQPPARQAPSSTPSKDTKK